ncbi:hypothetical protein AB9P05_05915 [Roseivirga sp. BDSF3-8]|uniref:hypothetical protein n=1 Tax=Roseivirga sp. BDSF3-8 TaxID=3241598 RepID=UPI003531B699
MKKTLLFILTSALFLALQACEISDNEVKPTDPVTRIFETGDFERNYVPIDIRQTPDGGYLMLASVALADSDFQGIYLFKADKEGLVEWEHLADNYVNPVSELLPDGSNGTLFRLVAMDKLQLGTHLLSVDVSGGASLTSVAYYPEMVYPLAAAQVGGGYAFLHWDQESKSSMKLTRLNGSTVQWSRSYDIYEDVEARIMAHLTRQTQPVVPFRTGTVTSGVFYFNGYNNFTLSLTFVDANTGDQIGVLNGTRYASGIMQIAPMAENKLALARYREDGSMVYAPAAPVDTRGTATARDLPGNALPELSPYAQVFIKKGSVDDQKIVLYASTTRNGRISLFAYDEGGTLLGTRYLGSGNRFEAGGVVFTDDGGLAVQGRTYVAGRFARLCLFKLSPDDLKEIAAGVSAQ